MNEGAPRPFHGTVAKIEKKTVVRKEHLRMVLLKKHFSWIMGRALLGHALKKSRSDAKICAYNM